MICNFCYRHCEIEEGNKGFCRVRKVENNQLISTGYGYLDAIAIDPIEKKPLFHFLPGSKTLSVAESGCNYRCDFCQNWQLSQSETNYNAKYVSPLELVNLALQYKVPSISFTYSEPIVWQDYIIDTSLIAKKHGLKTIMVTNGSFSNEARETLSPLIDAFNIDLKGDASYYKKICKGNINPVIEGIKYLVEQGNHIEVTTLLIESIHTKKVVQELAKILKDCGVQVWHLSRFFPNYKMSDIAETSERFLSDMISKAKESGIPYIYGGNTSINASTLCSKCNHVLINNHTDSVAIKKDCKQNIQHVRCKYCDAPLYGVFD